MVVCPIGTKTLGDRIFHHIFYMTLKYKQPGTHVVADNICNITWINIYIGVRVYNVSIFNLKVTEIDDIKKVISLENVFLPLWVTQCLSLPNLLVGNLSSVSQRTSCFLPPTFNVMESLKVNYILVINILLKIIQQKNCVYSLEI